MKLITMYFLTFENVGGGYVLVKHEAKLEENKGGEEV